MTQFPEREATCRAKIYDQERGWRLAFHRPGKETVMQVLRTPEDRFDNLPDYPFAPHYVEIDGLRVHYLDEGPRNGQRVVLLHGEPSWSFLYRKMIPVFVAAGYRTVAPDLVGFGKSDKPAAREDYTYQRHVDWLWSWFEALALEEVILFGQDWGSLLGLRLVAEHPEHFEAVAIANGGLPTGDQKMPEAFHQWRRLALNVSRLQIGRVIQGGTVSRLSKEVLAGYEAPFPDESYKAGTRVFPGLVPITPDDPATEPNRRAWESLRRFEKPFLTTFSDGDPITARTDLFLRRAIPGAKGQPHTTIREAGHFVQEDKGEELAGTLVEWLGALA